MDSQVRRYFDLNASGFDSLYRSDSAPRRILNRLFRRAIYERFALTLAHSQPIAGSTVLDVGCGSGRYAVEYARQGALRVVGLDYAPRMLELARALAAREGVSDRCEFIEADFSRHTFTETFDTVIAIGVFDYLTRPADFLARMAAVARQRVIATFPGKSLIRMRLRQLRYRLGNCPVFFYAEQEVHELARRSGLAQHDMIHVKSSGGGYVLVGAAPGASPKR